MGEFSGKTAVVTGATRGIGRAISLALLEEGATVLGIYGNNHDAAKMLQDHVGEAVNRLHLVSVDVANYESVTAFYRQVEEDYDTIDILVSNAGIRRDSVLAMMKSEDWQRVIDVNLNGSFNMAKSAVMLMMKQKYGRIIFITSPMSHLGFSGQSNYSASKAGQIGMMRSLSKETAKRKITVNCVSPGFIETDFIAELTDDQKKEYKKFVPMRRFGKPNEVADAVLFLASSKAAYITGSVLEVTGGI